jgi:hypothetical protein
VPRGPPAEAPAAGFFNPDHTAFRQVKQINGKSLVLSAPNNGNLTVTIGDQTQIEKTVQASLGDIQTGERISAQGTRGTDSIFAADSIQIGGNQRHGRDRAATS